MPDEFAFNTSSLPPAPENVAALSRVGRYLLRREIGRGYSSVVFEALDTRGGETVAMKLLMPPAGMSAARRAEMIERFTREARAVAALSHPAIVSVREAGHDAEGRPFLTMELLRGETLRARLVREGALPPEEAVSVALHLADGLRHAHERGIVHRDVKPDNVFLQEDGQIKLMDFGVAQMLADGAITQTGTVVGSPAYMSPEQIVGGRLDAASDVFSLGVTLAEMVQGRKPYDAPTIPAVMHRILYRAPDIAGVQPRILRPVLARALARRRTSRYPDMPAFAEALHERVVPRLPAVSVNHGAWTASAEPLLPGRAAPIGEVTRLGTAGGKAQGRAAWIAMAAGVVTLAALPFLLNHARSPGVTEETLPPSAGRVRQVSAVWHRAPLVLSAPLPRHVSAPLPRLPAQADAADWNGVVVVRAQVTPNGQVQSAALAASSGLPAVDRAAVQAVQKWRYAPIPDAKPRAVTERVAFSAP